MIRLAAALVVLWSTLAHAACEGPNLIDAMGPAERAEMARATASAPYPEGNLWRADRDGHSVHVLGTLHIPDPRHGAIMDEVADIVRAADLVVLEVTGETEARLQNIMVERPEVAVITDGPSLIDLMGDEGWAPVADALRARGIPPFVGAKFRPWLVMMLLSLPACAMDEIASGQLGLDGQVEAVARAGGVPLAELDEVDSLLATLNSGTPEEQVDMLRIAIATPVDQTALQATMYDSYFAGRHREIWEFNRVLAEDMAAPEVFGRMEAQLLDARNAAWEAKLPALIDGRDAVIAVGAAHLSGETGVLSALDRMGYALTRVPLAAERP